MRTDPTDNGGLFIGRRPGTAPVHHRALPQRGGAGRARVDAAAAALVLLAMTLVNLAFWGPIPAGWLWIAAQVQYHSGSIGLALLVGFLGLLVTLMVGLMVLKRLDAIWVLVRRAAGHDQRKGVIGVIFATTAVLGGAGFTFWLLIIAGPGASLAPTG